jgi:hypothetical protein
MLCTIDFSVCQNEKYDSNGYATWVAAPLQVVRSILECSMLLQMLLLVSFIVYAFFVDIFETAFISSVQILLPLLALVYYLRVSHGCQGKKA